MLTMFGVLPNTSFSQNVSLVAITKVVNRFALATGASFLILCGLIPKLSVGYSMGANTNILVHTPQAVQLIFGGSGIVPAAMVAILLNVLLPKEKKT